MHRWCVTDRSTSSELTTPPAGHGLWASIAVSMVIHLALLGTFAAVGGFDVTLATPAAVELELEESAPLPLVSVVSEPVPSAPTALLDGAAESLPAIASFEPVQPTLTPGGGRGPGRPVSGIATSDLARSIGPLGRGNSGVGTGDGEGTGDGKGVGFFGRRASGERIVYVVDASKSMNQAHPGPGKSRFGRVKLELIHSVKELAENQKFFIVFFNERAIPMPSDRLVDASQGAKLQYLRWMIDVAADGKTDPAAALLLALRLKPDTIYFLTDGDFRTTIVREVAVTNQGLVKIHTIGFSQERGEKLLQAIAEQNGGTYTFVPPDDAGAKVADAGPKPAGP
jgi:hypothetical protein